MLDVAAFLLLASGPNVAGGLPREEVCGGVGCDASTCWVGLLPSPVVMLVTAMITLDGSVSFAR